MPNYLEYVTYGGTTYTIRDISAIKTVENQQPDASGNVTLSSKADDVSVVHKANSETITGNKTFSASPIIKDDAVSPIINFVGSDNESVSGSISLGNAGVSAHTETYGNSCFEFHHFSPSSNGSSLTAYKETFSLPSVTANRTSSVAYKIITTKNCSDIISSDIKGVAHSDEIAIVVNGNTASQNVAEGEYVAVVNSTITNIADGLYVSNNDVDAGVAFTDADLTSASKGGLNENLSLISQNTEDISTNASAIATNTDNIATNTQNISSNTTAIATNSTNISKNTTSINKLQSEVGIVIDGKTSSYNVSVGDIVVVKNSTISGISDGLYKTTSAVSAGTAFTSAKLSAISTGLGNAFGHPISVENGGTGKTTIADVAHRIGVYHSQLGASASTTFTMVGNVGFLFGRRGGTYIAALVGYWDSGATVISSSGTTPTITTAANSNAVGVKNNLTIALPVIFITGYS